MSRHPGKPRWHREVPIEVELGDSTCTVVACVSECSIDVIRVLGEDGEPLERDGVEVDYDAFCRLLARERGWRAEYVAAEIAERLSVRCAEMDWDDMLDAVERRAERGVA